MTFPVISVGSNDKLAKGIDASNSTSSVLGRAVKLQTITSQKIRAGKFILVCRFSPCSKISINAKCFSALLPRKRPYPPFPPPAFAHLCRSVGSAAICCP